MTLTRFLFDSLRYHGRANLAVGLGATVGAAVLAGALLVGDSLRGSLRDRADRQLAGIELALVGDRFFREELADDVGEHVRPAILLQGTVLAGDQRVGHVTVIGVDKRFLLGDMTPEGSSATVSHSLAQALHLEPGSQLQVTVQKASAIPRSSALAKRDTTAAIRTMSFTAHQILPQGAPLGEFTLNPGPAIPLNLIVPLRTLQREIDQPGRINALLSPRDTLDSLQAELKHNLTLDDWGIVDRVAPTAKSYMTVESRRLILEPAVVEAAKTTAVEKGERAGETFVYLANSIAAKGAEIPYSVVAGIDPKNPPPLNPLGEEFSDDEILLVDWKESPLKVNPGDAITLKYFKPEVEGKIDETSHTFRLKAKIPLIADPDIVPPFPGITDKLEITKWDPPFPYDNTRIKPRDERYWKEYRTTPKAYITLNTARKLWGTRFGDTTSVRLLPRAAPTPVAPSDINEALLKNLDPKRGGFVFENVRERAHAAGQGSTDFGMLFLGFSFFLIVSALMLVGLLFRLNLERRARQIGLLRAVGYPLLAVRSLLLVEGLIISAIGSLIGLAAAVGYAAAMLYILAKLWPTPGVESFLKLHVSATSLAIGFAGSVVMSGAAIWWAVRGLSRIEPSHLLKGVSSDERATFTRSRWATWVAIVAAAGGVALLATGPFMPPGESQAGTFFGGGSLLLIAGLALVWIWLKRPRRSTIRGLTPLGTRNATRNPIRSLLTAGLLASAAFLLVAVESFRREPDRDFLQKNGGSGGFPLLAQTDSPVFNDLTGEAMLNDIERAIQRKYQQEKRPAAEREAKVEEVQRAFAAATLFPFRVRAGDDASCLNLYQAARPRVLGVPDALIDRGGFQFSDTEAKSPEEKANPWLLLKNVGDTVPAFVEENTAVWQLKKGLGDIIEVPDEEGRPVKLRIAGLLKDSVFQSEVLIGDSAFRRSFPRNEGFSYFLIDVAPGTDPAVVKQALEENLGVYGLEATRTTDRVAAYLAVQNTYLTTFQLLGGFGLLLGVLGLAVVLLRNVWERRSELALLRAMGYRVGTLNRLVFVENSLLLLLGLGAGVLAALAAVAPHMASGGSIPWGRLAIMLGAVLIVGLIAAGAAVMASVRTPIVAGLRKE
jgi:ABC-type antimicrobial peptide transport system permease subunit